MLQPRRKISHRFFLSILAIVVLPIGIMGYESYVLARRALTTFAFQHMATIAENKANHVDTWLQERLDDIGVVARLPAIREVCRTFREEGSQPLQLVPEGLIDTLELIEATSPSYENTYILLTDGRILSATHPDRTHTQGPHVEKTIERVRSSGTPVMGPAYQDSERMGWHVQLASRIEDQNGETLAFIVAVLDLSKMIDPILLERIGLGQTGETYLVDREGRIISESRFLDVSERMEKPFETQGIRAALEQQRGTSVYTNYMGREVLGSYVWLPIPEWGILAEMEIDEIMAPLASIQAIGLLTSLLVGLVCLLMALVVSRRVSMPIVQAAEAATRIAQGDLEQQIRFSSRDEVGALAASFNTMARQLAQSVAALRQKEESLQKAYNELVMTQEQLLCSERMAAIGELVASVAHEMRSPLSSIRLNLQIIGRSLGKGTDLHEHYEIAFDQVMQMERMFSDLLNYSKPIEIQKKAISVENLIDRSLQELEGELSARNISVETRLAPDLPPIIGDPDKLEQVLINVIKNALEASGTHASIQVQADTEWGGAGGLVRITVTDHGVGISARNLKIIFKPFFTTKQKGTGLGLPIVKKILEAHGASISVESEPGMGTSVRLDFPLVRGSE